MKARQHSETFNVAEGLRRVTNLNELSGFAASLTQFVSDARAMAKPEERQSAVRMSGLDRFDNGQLVQLECSCAIVFYREDTAEEIAIHAAASKEYNDRRLNALIAEQQSIKEEIERLSKL
jgi:hypothetical protein